MARFSPVPKYIYIYIYILSSDKDHGLGLRHWSRHKVKKGNETSKEGGTGEPLGSSTHHTPNWPNGQSRNDGVVCKGGVVGHVARGRRERTTIERDGEETHGGGVGGCDGRPRAQFGKEKLTERSRSPGLADLTHGEFMVAVGLGEHPQKTQEVLMQNAEGGRHGPAAQVYIF